MVIGQTCQYTHSTGVGQLVQVDQVVHPFVQRISGVGQLVQVGQVVHPVVQRISLPVGNKILVVNRRYYIFKCIGVQR